MVFSLGHLKNIHYLYMITRMKDILNKFLSKDIIVLIYSIIELIFLFTHNKQQI